jgi:ABC-2 type transport system ATP-binding protein
MNSVVLESVSKVFQQTGLFSTRRKETTHALKNISLEVGLGEVLGLLGPNGSGKSTTLKLISTILLPDRGRVLVGGWDTRLQGDAVRKQVGFALASERSFFPRLTCRENLEFFAALENVPQRQCKSHAESALRRVGLEEARDKQAMKLSSGTYQRLGIARALLKNPSVLLLDEPTRSLDPAAAAKLWKLIQELSANRITVVIATHDYAEATAVCGRVAILKRGELMSTQAISDFDNDHLRSFYLEITGESAPVLWHESVPA